MLVHGNEGFFFLCGMKQSSFLLLQSFSFNGGGGGGEEKKQREREREKRKEKKEGVPLDTMFLNSLMLIKTFHL
jgi:hypothetical protein